MPCKNKYVIKYNINKIGCGLWEKKYILSADRRPVGAHLHASCTQKSIAHVKIYTHKCLWPVLTIRKRIHAQSRMEPEVKSQ